MHRDRNCAVNWDRNLKPKLAIMRQCTSVTDRQTDRQTDTDIVALARDVYITSRAKNPIQPNLTHGWIHVRLCIY